MNRPVTQAYAQLNAKIMPIARGNVFEIPLGDALEKNGFGEVAGGGTLQEKSGEIVYCGVDVDLFDLEHGAPFVCDFLTKCGAPRGSKLTYKQGDQKVELPFGRIEGLGIYLNGTDLPAEVYKQCSVDAVMEAVDRLIGKRLRYRGYWQGPTETALYLYSDSAQEVRGAIAVFIAEYPLCQRARVETVA